MPTAVVLDVGCQIHRLVAPARATDGADPTEVGRLPPVRPEHAVQLHVGQWGEGGCRHWRRFVGRQFGRMVARITGTRHTSALESGRPDGPAASSARRLDQEDRVSTHTPRALTHRLVTIAVAAAVVSGLLIAAPSAWADDDTSRYIVTTTSSPV